MDESRNAPRHTFGVQQFVAKIVGDQMPSLEALRCVRCADISRSGFAYYQETRPDHDELIIALGIPPEHIYVTARIVHVKLIELCGGLAFRVGCQFTGRARYCKDTKAFVRDGNADALFESMMPSMCGEAPPRSVAMGPEEERAAK